MLMHSILFSAKKRASRNPAKVSEQNRLPFNSPPFITYETSSRSAKRLARVLEDYNQSYALFGLFDIHPAPVTKQGKIVNYRDRIVFTQPNKPILSFVRKPDEKIADFCSRIFSRLLPKQ